MTSLDGINGRSIQTLLRGENDSKQSGEFQATSKKVLISVAAFPNDFVFSEKPLIFQQDEVYFMGGGAAGGL